MRPTVGARAAFIFAAALLSTSATADDGCDAAAGAEVFASKCALCHSVVKNHNGAVGPSLHGVVGRKPGKAARFAYSPALVGLTDAWSIARLDWFLQDPQSRVPGTYMAFSGLRNDAARAAVICYLTSVK